MVWAFTGLALILHLYFWGAGLTFLLLPKRLLRCWPAFCPMCGLALQSAVVWAGAHTGLRGTDRYGIASLVIPAAFIVAALLRLGSRRVWALLCAAKKWWGLWLVMALAFCLQILPLTRQAPVLTAVSLGSCDAADYAAGARVLQSFSTRDRSGFLGLKEVVELSGIDNFPDHWLRLNHFTPSALIALNGAVIHRRPHQLVSLFAVVLAVIGLPSVFWLARSTFRMRPLPSCLVTLLYGCSPIVLYGVYHCALGQLIAAPAVALLTAIGVRLIARGHSWRSSSARSGLLLVSNWLILGAYNFFIAFSYIPLLAFAAWHIARTWRWRRTASALLFLAANLIACALIFPGRVVALVDRFALLHKTQFGWPIPTFTPSGWYGIFANEKLDPASSPIALLLAIIALAALAFTCWRVLARGRWQIIGVALACTLPAFAGYAILTWQGRQPGDYSSYDAYKIFTVFFPGILISLCLWLNFIVSRALLPRVLAATLFTVLFAMSCAMTSNFDRGLKGSGLILDSSLTKLATIENMPQVASVNICLESYWSRLWANYFLLRKPQYFILPTYEGRSATPLRGEWDLRERSLFLQPAKATDVVEISRACYLVDRRSETYLDLRLDEGWLPPEGTPRFRWYVSGGSPQFAVTNPHPFALRAVLQFSAMSFAPRTLQLLLNSEQVWQGALSPTLQTTSGIEVLFPPGRSLLRFETPEPAVSPPGETRRLTIALHELSLHVTAP